MAEKITKEIDFSKPRDLYNRAYRLQTNLERVNELPNPDKDAHLFNSRSTSPGLLMVKLTIIRNISEVITF